MASQTSGQSGLISRVGELQGSGTSNSVMQASPCVREWTRRKILKFMIAVIVPEGTTQDTVIDTLEERCAFQTPLVLMGRFSRRQKGTGIRIRHRVAVLVGSLGELPSSGTLDYENLFGPLLDTINHTYGKPLAMEIGVVEVISPTDRRAGAATSLSSLLTVSGQFDSSMEAG